MVRLASEPLLTDWVPLKVHLSLALQGKPVECSRVMTAAPLRLPAAVIASASEHGLVGLVQPLVAVPFGDAYRKVTLGGVAALATPAKPVTARPLRSAAAARAPAARRAVLLRPETRAWRPEEPEVASIETMWVFAQVLDVPVIFLGYLVLAVPCLPGCIEPDMSVAEILLAGERLAESDASGSIGSISFIWASRHECGSRQRFDEGFSACTLDPRCRLGL